MQLGSDPKTPACLLKEGQELVIVAPYALFRTYGDTLATLCLSTSCNNQLHFLSQGLSICNN